LKKDPKPAAKRELVDYAQQVHGISQRGACEMLNLRRSVYRYRPNMNRDLPVIAAIQAVLEIHPG
jgi:putative transposase